MIAVAAPAGVIAALFALLFMLAWYYLGNTVVRMLNVDLPVIGNVIGNAVASGLEIVYAGLLAIMDSILSPLAATILRPVIAIESQFDVLTQNALAVYQTIHQLRFITIPSAVAVATGEAVTAVQPAITALQHGIDGAITFASQVEHDVEADLQRGIAGAVAFASTVEANVEADLARGLADVITFASTVEANVEADLQRGIASAVAFASQVEHDVEADLQRGLQAAADSLAHAVTQSAAYAEQTAIAATGVLVTDLDQSITNVLSGIWTDVDGAITDVIGVIGTGDAAIRDALGRIDWSIPANLAAVAALTGVTTLTLARYLRDCGIPNCQNLSQFGKDLSALGSLVGEGAFLALVAELIHNPSAAHTIYDDTLGPVVDEGLSLARSLLGV